MNIRSLDKAGVNLGENLQQKAERFWDQVEITAFPVGASYQHVLSELAVGIVGTEPLFIDMLFQVSSGDGIPIGSEKKILPNDGSGTLVSAILYLTGTDENAEVVIFTKETEVFRPAVNLTLPQMGIERD